MAALAAGAVLAAAQLVPTVMAGVSAQRTALATPDFWSLHPVALWEAVAPGLFGNYDGGFLVDLPWMGALNFGRDPFFYSLYVGPLVLLLAGVGLASRFRRNVFWLVVVLLFLAAALGGYTPLYPLARDLVPPLLFFRFPVKYFVIGVFACAVLAAEGFAVLLPTKTLLARETVLPPASGGDRRVTAGPASSAFSAVLRRTDGALEAGSAEGSPWRPAPDCCCRSSLFLMPDLVARAARALAESAHLRDPAAGAAFLGPHGPVAAGARVRAPVRRRAVDRRHLPRPPRRAAVLFIATCADLLIANGGLNPTTETANLTPPAWYQESAGAQRLYVGGRVRGFMNTNDPDAVRTWQLPAGATMSRDA